MLNSSEEKEKIITCYKVRSRQGQDFNTQKNYVDYTKANRTFIFIYFLFIFYLSIKNCLKYHARGNGLNQHP